MNHRLTRGYETAFLLDAGKLARLNQVVLRRIADLGGLTEVDFKVTLKDEMTIVPKDLESLLALDNTVKNPIKKLMLTYYWRESDDRRKQEVVEIRYRANDFHNNVEYDLISPKDSITWIRDTSAELEEQLERTQVRDLYYRIPFGKLAFVFPVIFSLVALMQVLNLWTGSEAIKSKDEVLADRLGGTLDTNAIAFLRRRMLEARTPEEKVAYLFSRESIVLGASPNSSAVSRSLGATLPRASIFADPKIYVLGVPVLVVLALAVWLFRTCYPRWVFKWGDIDSWHDGILRRRRTIWSILISSIVIGVLVNMFSSALFAIME